jgi:hypothetical protein
MEVTAMAIKRMTAVVLAAAIEAVLIAAVVLSTIGTPLPYRPTPNGPGLGQVPAPTFSR